ncbi:hypothetical protein [Defluviimonas sp. SAOS-178_SWC]|uniref:hypothetical protein n=1 Tax=Defluviimonas sp. SAOS-178_SWC TaxID=3121287 RepID=UPI0032215C40
MQLNKAHAVKTVDRVAAELGETVDRLHNLAIGMEPADGAIWVHCSTRSKSSPSPSSASKISSR